MTTGVRGGGERGRGDGREKERGLIKKTTHTTN